MRTDTTDSGVRRLIRALYGLRGSARDWYKCLEKELRSLGYENSNSELGLWRKLSQDGITWIRLSVYVDDMVLSASTAKEVDAELEKIRGVWSVTMVPFDKIKRNGTNYQRYDVNGSDLWWRQGGYMLLCQERYIEKVMKEFGMEDCSPVSDPSFSFKSVAAAMKSQKPTNFPIKRAIGMLNWLVSSTRPDILMPVQAIAKLSALGCTQALVNVTKKVIRYLSGTKEYGIEWSREREASFHRLYSSLLPEDEQHRLGRVAHFSDASFASCPKTLKSTSGMITYLRGSPVIWRGKTQGLMTFSTMESESVAASDLLVIEERSDFLHFYADQDLNDRSEDLIFMDHLGAVTTAKSDNMTPKNRHYALRFARVRQAARRLVWCPTHLERADAVTKNECTKAQRDLLLFGIADSIDFENDECENLEENSFFMACFSFSVGYAKA